MWLISTFMFKPAGLVDMLITGKPVFGMSDQMRNKPICSTTEASWMLEILDKEPLEIYYLCSEKQKR